MEEKQDETVEMKAGRKISADTGAQLEQILSIVQKLLGLEEQDAKEDAAEGDDPLQGSQGSASMMSMIDATMIQVGESVKAIGTVDNLTKVGGYLVRFTPKGDADLTGDRFSKTTDFDFEFPGKSTTYFNHGLDGTLKKRRMTPMALSVDEVGVWAEGILDESDKYQHVLADLARAGKLGLSSGVPAHLVEREQEGKNALITYWPLGKDASYTHTPAEPRNVVMPLKTFVVTAPVAATAAETNYSGEVKTMEIMQELEGLKTAVSAMAASVEEIKKAAPATTKAGTIPAQTRDVNDRPYKNIGENLLDIKRAQTGQGMTSRLEAVKNEFKAAGMSEFINADGGFSLQPDFTLQFLDHVYNPPNTNSILADVTRQPVSGNGFRAMIVDETSRATTRRGGFLGYWLSEGVAPTSSKPQFRRFGTDLAKVAALTYLTDELLADAPALGAWVMREGPNELRFQVESKVISGSGVGVPLGIIVAPALVTVAKEAGQAAASIVTENIVKMYSRMAINSYQGAKWYINQEILPQLFTLSLAVGVGGVPVFMPPAGLSGAPFGTLLGRPVVPVEYCSALGSVGDIIFANLSEYVLADNGGIQAASSIHVNFLTDETALRFTYRVNGLPMWNNTMTPYLGTNTISPFVTLAAR